MDSNHLNHLLQFIGFFSPILCAADSPSFFQFSTINALLQGICDGELTIGELLQKGQIGSGTFDALNGEMVIIDNRCFRITDRGTAEEVARDETTSFAAVASFPPTEGVALDSIGSFEDLKSALDQFITSPNLVHVFHLTGTFQTIRARSVSKQSKPYPLITEVTAQQAVFQYSNVSGDLVGFWCPSFFDSLNIPGFHFHFIDRDRKLGGHLLDCSFQKANVIFTPCYQVSVQFPRNQEFARVDLSGDKEKEIQQIEK